MAEPEPGKLPEVKMHECEAEGCDYKSPDKWRVDSHYRMKHDPKFAEKRKAYQEGAAKVKKPQGRPPKAMTPKLEPAKEQPKPAPTMEAPRPTPAGEAKKAESFPAKPKKPWYEVDIF